MNTLIRQIGFNDLFKKVISEKFKPVDEIKMESDYTIESQYVGEYDRLSYALITGKKDSYYSQKRLTYEVIIYFKDRTAFRTHLTPQDYLGKMRESVGEVPSYIGSDLLIRNERQMDFDKVIDTLLKRLQGVPVENPTLETVDYL